LASKTLRRALGLLLLLGPPTLGADPVPVAFADRLDRATLAQLAFEALRSSYPDLELRREGDRLVLGDGTSFPFDDGRPKDADELLADPDLFDMFCYAYPIGARTLPGDGGGPGVPYREDPGRIRVQAFFARMYGATETEVKAHLTRVRWIPSSGGPTVGFTRVNGAAEALQRVSDELDQRPELWPFLVPSGGTFNWRPIAGTSRLSVHSFGAAVDVNVARSDYWHDTVVDEAAEVGYRNRIPAAVVEVFERNGFIWGGWWYHFDTMHFEYRPEILAYARLVAARLTSF